MNKYQREKHRAIIELKRQWEHSFGGILPYKKVKRLYKSFTRIAEYMMGLGVSKTTQYIEVGPIIITGLEIFNSGNPVLPYSMNVDWVYKQGGSLNG